MSGNSNVALLFFALVLTSCGSKDDPGPAIPTWTTGYGADQSTSFAFRGDSFAYLASEAHSGVDVNSDGDKADTFPVAVDTSTQTETLISVPARGLVWVGEYLYLDVYEEDGDLDWNSDPLLDVRVLMYWTEGMSDPAYVLTLDADAEDALLSTGELGVCVPDGATSLEILSATDPAALELVNLDLNGAASLELLALREGLLFVGVNENTAGVDENGDGDTTDERVLGLLDLTGADEFGQYSLVSVSLAISPGETPLFAEAEGDHEWLVAFLVDEFWQVNGAGMSLNSFAAVNESFSPCVGLEDDDLEDEVLHFSLFSDLRDGGLEPKNTGLVGSERIIRAGDFLGTVSREGDEAICDLNGDGDLDDRVFRWVRADRNNMSPVLDNTKLHALSDLLDQPGHELYEFAAMGDRFVIVVNEISDGENHDGLDEDLNGYDWDLDGSPLDDRDLVAWIAPDSGGAWTFHHDSTVSFGWATPTWIGELEGTDRVGIGFSEQSNDEPYDLNNDGDKIDSVPTFAYYDAGTGFMEFPGYAIGADKDEMGIVVFGGWGYYRVSEAENGGDLDGDGDAAGYLLYASHLSTGQTVIVSPLNFFSGDAVEGDPINASCAAFLVREGGAVGDLNGDTSTSGFAVRYLRY
jgi:hypothetical protein